MQDLREDKKLYKLIEKKYLTIQDFQYIVNHNFVTSSEKQTPDKTNPLMEKYIIRYQNGDWDTVYIKK